MARRGTFRLAGTLVLAATSPVRLFPRAPDASRGWSAQLELKKVWRDGTRALVLEPFDLLTRLVASVPPPIVHFFRYFGVFSSQRSFARPRGLWGNTMEARAGAG